ncbi:MAG: transcriptional regulator [Blastomonas sp. CACIA14H2]|uniref:aminotransferase-like domain-containing protein n=1 Tax=Blastomonas sp. CACIA14H2 TaxID=1419876 RepID=UPI0003D0393C|nr:MAG: transcriptional regulator [Blastomonas sp. CACIA14H2]
MPLYRSIAARLRAAIEQGAYVPGQKVSSARKIAQREGVSLTTAVDALRVLESEGLLLARPRSGFFVVDKRAPEPVPSRPSKYPQFVTSAAIARSIFLTRPDIIFPLGAALPDPAWLPLRDLQRALTAAGRRLGPAAQTYSMPPGRADLRRQISARAVNWGATFGPDEVVITSGETQAMRLALKVTCKAGDVVAVESPTYFGALMLLETLGLRALEIPTDPRTGLSIDALERALTTRKIAAVLASPNVQNPLGASMPLNQKKRLVTLLQTHQVPLIEDDVYGDLVSQPGIRAGCKAFDTDGLVLYCSSASKTLAPGWRIGWIAAGRYVDAVLRARLEESLAGSPLIEAALADFLSSGDYERHLRRFQSRVEGGIRAIAARIEDSFPAGTRFSRPANGYLLWVELPKSVDALEVHRQALGVGIGISPGPLFSPQTGFQHHLRLNCANEPSAGLLQAIDRLGAICASLAEAVHR